ncbi:MAG: AEC family transporter, partial [Phascolarctobacterium sp.]|nr:AEC family transporter [Candidatus Phascolarctobacterium equi]
KSVGVMNKLVFRVFLPALLFDNLTSQDFAGIWDTEFVVFCFVITIVSIFLAYLISLLFKNKGDRGEIIQASYRSAAATLGIAFMSNIYDNVSMVALMIIGSVPLYNIAAVLILSISSPKRDETQDKKKLLGKSLKGIVTNPIIIGVLAGLIWSVLRLPKPVIAFKAISYLGNVASPLALIVLGASFELSDVSRKKWAILVANVNKLILFAMMFLPIAIYLGFRDEKIVAILIMLGSATTSSSFIMARNMGHDGAISSGSVMTTTFLSSFTLTLWLFILKTLGYI